uniref:Uncharacterized protein n=1 Tax=Arundo donax TaxID=35708 RepID=A0A0A9FH76_ARUDO
MPPDVSHRDIHHGDAGLGRRGIVLSPGNKRLETERPHRRIELISFVTCEGYTIQNQDPRGDSFFLP